MILVAVVGSLAGGRLRLAAGLDGRRLPGASALAARRWPAAGFVGAGFPLARDLSSRSASANGAFAAAAIATMMQLAGRGRGGREGVRMGMWGAAQAIAFGARRPGRHGGR